MMLNRSWTGLALSCWLCSQTLLYAQPRPSNGFDVPGQRYLPPPIGSSNLSEQVRQLEQLRSSNASGKEAAPFKLSNSQKQMLDSIVESFRNEQGELDLPSPDSVPPKWIESLIPDPQQRQQAKRMLEDYARDRNLRLRNEPANQPPGDSNRSQTPLGEQPTQPTVEDPFANDPFKSDFRSNDPSQTPSQTPSQSPRAGANNSVTAPRPMQGQQPATNQPRDPSQPRDPKQPFGAEPVNGDVSGQPQHPLPPGESSSTALPADKSNELKQLFETLKQFGIEKQLADQAAQRQRSSEQNELRPNAGTSAPPLPRSRDANKSNPTGSARPNSSLPRPPANRATDKQRQPGQLGAQGTPPGSRLRQRMTDSDPANNATPGGSRKSNELTPQGTFDAPSQDPSGMPENSRSSGPTGRSNQLDDAAPSPTPPPELNPFDPNFDHNRDVTAANDPFAQPQPFADGPRQNQSSRPAAPQPFNVRRLSERSSGAASGTSSPPTKSDSQLDVKRSVDQRGLGPTLRSIYEKALKEQGLDTPKANTSASPSSNNSATNKSPGGSGSQGNLSNIPSPALNAGSLNNGSVGNGSVTPKSSVPSSAFANESSWSKFLNDAWKALAEAPMRPSPSNSAGSYDSGSSNAAAASSPIGLPEFRWTGSMTLVVLVAAGLIGLLMWLARRNASELTSPSQLQAERLRAVIANGLKSRADVIRAFHRLVRPMRPVADWWTHHSVVKHFHSQSPQLAPAINELAIVYEQARYFPDDVELSPQQLDKVKEVLEGWGRRAEV